MSTPRREDFPPGLEGFRAWRRALGDDVEPSGPWDPKKWGDFAQRQPTPQPGRAARPIGLVRLKRSGRRAEVFTVPAVPPADLRVRWVAQVPGRVALNAFFEGVHPTELQRVLPAIRDRNEYLLDGHDVGHPIVRQGRGAALLVQGPDPQRWSLTISEHRTQPELAAEGRREDLVALAVLYADTVLGSVGRGAAGALWVLRVRAARTALHEELGDDFEVVR